MTRPLRFVRPLPQSHLDSGCARPSETGSRASTEPSSTVSALTGFDPARWQPIETAPRDGTEVDLWVPNKGRRTDCHFHCIEWLWWTTRGDEEPGWQVVKPTHWMPLPAAPEFAQ